MSYVWDQDVQDREELKLQITRLGKAEYFLHTDTQLFYFKLHNVDNCAGGVTILMILAIVIQVARTLLFGLRATSGA